MFVCLFWTYPVDTESFELFVCLYCSDGTVLHKCYFSDVKETIVLSTTATVD